MRFFHNRNFHRHLNTLYRANWGRKVPLLPFEESTIAEFSDLRNKKAILSFFKDFKNKGGIYKFSLINKPNVFYIGSTVSLYNRFYQHTKPEAYVYNFDWFHILARDWGWDKFKFEILELENDIKTLRDKENFLLQKYFPLLNTKKRASIHTLKKEAILLKNWQEKKTKTITTKSNNLPKESQEGEEPY